MVWSDKAICWSRSRRKVEWGGWSKGVLRIPFAGVWREQIFWETFASTQLGYLVLFMFFSTEFKKEKSQNS